MLFLENIVNIGRKLEIGEWLEVMIFFFFLESASFLGQKVHYPERLQATTCLFVRDHCILRTKSALLGMISDDDLFFRDRCIFSTKTALPGNDFK